MIVWTYYLVNLFGDFNVGFAAAFFPVLMFGLTIIVFFLFVREIFVKKTNQSKNKANIIAFISTFFMIVIPVFLSRTVAGIPEKESAAFFFMFLAFYLFLKSWKTENLKKAIIFGAFAGIATGLMGLVWGGVIYVLGAIGFSTLFAFIIGKIGKKEFLVYAAWIISTAIILLSFPSKYSIIRLVTSSDGAYLTFFVLIINFILWNTKLSKTKILSKIKLPKTLISLIVTFILGIGVISLFFGAGYIVGRISGLIQMFINPTTSRWGITVAENRQPYFIEWASNFGPFIKNIPIFFWLFFAGSVVLVKKMLNKIKKKDSWILTGLYVLFFFGLVFSRYSSASRFNGENFISKLFYFGSGLLFLGGLVYFYIKDYKTEQNLFRKINFNLLFLFTLLMITLVSVRSAVRLIMVLAPIASIFVGYLIFESTVKFRRINDETMKIIFGCVMILVLLSSLFAFWEFYNGIKGQAYSIVPSSYNQQWQKAMDWIRTETPLESVFGHWWDYGYWVQSIGNRATVLDGGNAITFWNYYMGRLVLTGDNQEDALEFLYNHNATHLLIDSTDIGKYGAFSSIGSDEYYDRFSHIGTFLLDEAETLEQLDKITYFYIGESSLDEDLIINENGVEIFLPKGQAGIGAILLSAKNEENIISGEFNQPYIIVMYQNSQYKIYLRYLFAEKSFIDFGSGIEAGAYIFPSVNNEQQGISINPVGAAMYLSPRLLRGLLVQKYILDDPFNNFPNFELIHSEQNLIVESFNNQGMDLQEFIYYPGGGILGPIKIWEINYAGDEEIKEEYLDKDASKYLSWKL